MEEKELKQVLYDLEKCYTISPEAYEGIIGNFDVYPFDDYQKMYYTIGYNGEYDELLEKVYDLKYYPLSHDEKWAELANEGGDVCWYGTRLSNAFSFELMDVLPHGGITCNNYKEIMKRVHKSKGKLSESVKKFFRDGKGELTVEWSERIRLSLTMFFEELQNLAGFYNITLSDMMRANVLKLGHRKLEKKLHGDGDNR